MALIDIVFVCEYHINLRTFEEIIYCTCVRCNAIRAICGERIISFERKFVVSERQRLMEILSALNRNEHESRYKSADDDDFKEQQSIS